MCWVPTALLSLHFTSLRWTTNRFWPRSQTGLLLALTGLAVRFYPSGFSLDCPGFGLQVGLCQRQWRTPVGQGGGKGGGGSELTEWVSGRGWSYLRVVAACGGIGGGPWGGGGRAGSLHPILPEPLPLQPSCSPAAGVGAGGCGNGCGHGCGRAWLQQPQQRPGCWPGWPSAVAPGPRGCWAAPGPGAPPADAPQRSTPPHGRRRGQRPAEGGGQQVCLQEPSVGLSTQRWALHSHMARSLRLCTTLILGLLNMAGRCL